MHSPAAPLRLRHPKADGDKPKPGARARVEYLGFDPFPQPAIRPHRTDFATNSPIQRVFPTLKFLRSRIRRQLAMQGNLSSAKRETSRLR